ncbi:flagellin [Paenibacillus gorillae]|uniref:flagellin N-terminal helical domain-containing protein n=1 Tax=Paenibacillus gorillae TaxID=1243662 RepID=UPI0004BB918D|nr:flagellin [Paenibacillus gorillae]
MGIISNISALNVSNKLRTTNQYKSKTMEKLSSGLRINRAADDAAGLAISEKMRGQIRGLEQASRNIQDGISLIQTAEGAMQEIHAMLQRMNELAVQTANGTYSDKDRANIQFEFSQLQSGIDNIAENTQFNGIKLLNGGSSGYVKAISTDTPQNYKLITITSKAGNNVSETLNNIISAFNKVKSGAVGDSDTQRVASKFVLAYDNDNLLLKCISGDGFFLGGGSPNLFFQGDVNDNYVYKFTQYINESDFIYIGDIGNSNDTLKFQFTTSETAQEGIVIQTGERTGDTLSLDMPNMTSMAIGINNLDISTIAGSSSAMSSLQNSINQVSTGRAKLGAYQNRLEHTQKNASNYAENLTSAESRIRDADMAKEMMALTKLQLLADAGQAILVQANASPQNVLKLLG